MPSWVPQWDQEAIGNPIGKRLGYEWNAGGNRSVLTNVDSNDRLLVLHGLEIDHVISEQDTEGPDCFYAEDSHLHDHPILESWRSQTAQPTLYLTGESVIDVYLDAKAFENITAFRADFFA